jgi:hypothetical protein
VDGGASDENGLAAVALERFPAKLNRGFPIVRE